jgi:S-adenosylmethionine hydrolase
MRAPPVVTLLTDFGARDPFVGIMKGVILGICPHAALVDLCHEVPAHDILAGSFLLAMAVKAFPAGTIHVAVVDPGVGGARRALLAEIDDQRFLAPDNGLLTYPLAAARQRRIRHLTSHEYWRHPVSTSFHGRDVFAPVAGHLAAGVECSRFGPEIEDPQCLEIPRLTRSSSGSFRATIVWIDRFGNCITNIAQSDLEPVASLVNSTVHVHVGDRPLGRLVACFAEVPPGQAGALLGSAGYLELFCNQGNLAQQWDLTAGDQISVALVPACAKTSDREGGV